jgi:hypothetical protein
MNTRYLIKSKNPNLHYFPESFYEALRLIESENLKVLDRPDVLILLRGLLSIRRKDTFSLFLFSTQIEYILLILLLRFFGKISRKRLCIYHQMHEPWYEQGRTSRRATFLGYVSNVMMSRLSDKTILPSACAMEKAKTFIREDRRVQLNLTFLMSRSVSDLRKKMAELEKTWQSAKTFSLIGGTGPDRNPEGFLSLSSIAQKLYPETTRFIRAGRDTNLSLHYSEMGVLAFPGYIPENTKNFLLNMTHFIVVPYKFSTQSAVIPESLSLGKLLILNNIPGFQYLKNYDFAFIVDFDNHDEIKACLIKIQSMTIEEYRERYWSAIRYFEEYHSNAYLSKNIELISH